MLRITIKHDELEPEVLNLDGDKALIGRDDYCEIRINHESISRKHASLSLHEDGDWWIKDAGSQNGVKINGKMLTGEATVRDRDTVGLGPFTLTFERLDTATSALRRSEFIRQASSGDGTKSTAGTVVMARDTGPISSGEVEAELARGSVQARRLRVRILAAVAGLLALLVLWRIYSIIMTPPPPKDAEKTWETDEFADPVLIMGARLEIVSTPPGTEVLLDGVSQGTTTADAAKPWQSKPLLIPVDASRSHQVQLRYGDATSPEQLATVPPEQTRRMTLRLWLPNRRVRFADGSERVAMLISESATEVILALEPDKEERFARKEIASMKAMPPIVLREVDPAHIQTQDGVPELRFDPFPDGPDSTNK